MRIQHNILAMNAYRNYTNNTSALGKNLEKLSSGYKINRAGDDAAGLAISEKMRAQITGLNAAQKNVKDGISLVKTAEGAMQEIHDMLNRMDYLATQSANGTYDNEVDRANLQKEVDSLKSEINRIADSANFNGINLLDGVSGMGCLSKLPVEYDTLSTAQGVTLGEVKDGGGTAGSFTINIDKMFSWGDTITIKGLDGDGNDISAATGVTLTMDAADGTGNFKGQTKEEQASSIANALAANFGAYFDIKAEGSQVTLTAKKEGTEEVPVITEAKVGSADADVTITNYSAVGTKYESTTAATAAGAGSSSVGTFNLNVFGNTTGAGTAANFEVGDTITLMFTDANGKLLTTSFKATEEMCSADANKATQAIVDYLNSDKATFDDNTKAEKVKVNVGGGNTVEYERVNTTGVDESQIKIKDLFTASSTTNGILTLTGDNAKSLGIDLKHMIVNRDGAKTVFGPATGSTAATNASDGDAQVWEDVVTKNFTTGDKIKYEGTLADGRKFEVELEAGKDFAVDLDTTEATAIQKTVENLGKALMSDSTVVTIKDDDGNVVGTMKGSDLFGDENSKTAEFKLTGIDGTSDTLTITSARKGTAAAHQASEITKGTLTPLAAAETTLTKNAAKAQTAAESSFTVDENLAYGTAIKVGDHTYEIVKDARDTSSRNNTAVVVSDLTNSKAVASAIAAAISGNETDYEANSVDGTVTVSSKKIGSGNTALAISTPYGDKIKTASFTFDPSVVREGSVLTFNDNTYEFVKKGGEASEGRIAIEVDDPAKASAKELGDAFANVVKNGVATVDDGKVTLRGVETEDGTISDPRISWENNLVLQIGDTADSFNQLSVKLSDMHTLAMGIDGVDISKQTSAQSAIDVIKNAINYVSSVRGDFGAIQNRLEHTANNLSVMAENIQDAESTIRDTDVAEEMMAYTKNNILVQSAQAMLAQANAVPQGVLQLLG